MIQVLKDMSAKERHTIEVKLTNNLISSDVWRNAQMIGITISQNFEWNTKQIIETAWKQNKHICVPKCDPKNKKLLFYKIVSYDQLESVFYNLLEPNPNECELILKNEIDLLVVPGLIFDQRGFRIGFGGGYYDRFLTDYTNETISICSEKQLKEKVPSYIYDIPVKNIVTESRLLNITN